jgi:hypothetical protein
MQVQVFWMRNPDGNTLLTVTTTLHGSAVPWNVCVSAYSGADDTMPSPFYSPQTSALGYTGRTPQTQALNTGANDMVYAVAFAANSDGTFPGDNGLSAGAGFTAEFTAITNPLVQDAYGNGGLITPVAQISSNEVTDPLGFIFAVGLKAKS